MGKYFQTTMCNEIQVKKKKLKNWSKNYQKPTNIYVPFYLNDSMSKYFQATMYIKSLKKNYLRRFYNDRTNLQYKFS